MTDNKNLWLLWFRVLILTLLLSLLIIRPISAEPVPQEPEIELMVSWFPTADRNIIICFDLGCFKHQALLINPYSLGHHQVPENELWFVTNEQNPWIYIVQRSPNAFQHHGKSQRIGAIQKTSGFIE